MKFTIKNEKLIPALFQQDSEPAIPISQIETIYKLPLNSSFTFNQELQKSTSGKQLLLEDLPFSLEEIQSHYENGYIIYRKGIQFDRKAPKCTRCANKDPHWFASLPCKRCDQDCVYCRRCLMMGRISACTPLISWTGPPPTVSENDYSLVWSGSLSEGQKIASDRVIDAIKQNSELLVWAVCGAGKTEVLFAGIEKALSNRKRVCIATPRTDVVLELTPRLKNVFPSLSVASLYGGTPDRHQYSPLTISTTHQLLRFYKAFDVIILDEVDAFPYSVDETLQSAVKQARKDISSIIYLTATPNEKWQKECRLGKKEYVTIPVRFHGYPLPVPKFMWGGNWKKLIKKKMLHPNVMKWIKERLANNQPALLFLPKIDFMEKILPLLQSLHANIQSVHAEDLDRKEKVQAMRNKEIPLLLTTTILERGVTIPNLDVAVLGAEDPIFTESALVQIAGRVGRSVQFPTGDITFFHYGKTEAMVKARKQILNMNGDRHL